jgi:hypothetical protein
MSAFAPRFLSLLFLLIAGSSWAAITVTPSAPDNPAAQAQLAENYGKLPLSFEENEGQTSDKVKFFSRGPGYSLFLTPDEAVLALRKPEPRSTRHAHEPPPVRMAHATPKTQEGAVLRMRLAGAREPARILGRDRQPGTVNYLKGRDPGQWRTGVATYGKVEYQGVYPGVDLVYYGNQRQLEYDFIVAPGADPNRIRLSFAGDGDKTVAPRLDGNGDLLLPTGAGEVRLHKPVVYQDIDGRRREIDGRFVVFPALSENQGERRVGFQVAEYDRARPLVIDPVLVYSTYLGGSGSDEGSDIAIDSAGNAYVAGITYSADFPVVNAKYPKRRGGDDVFVVKLSADGKRVIYSTYLGGSNEEHGGYYSSQKYAHIAVDRFGNAYVAGRTYSADFPVINAKYPQLRGNGDAFIVKLSADGQRLVYSTYLGGSDWDLASGIAVDGSGNAYVTGLTWSNDFPTANAKYDHMGGTRYTDAFVTKLSADGQRMIYSTYLGGSSYDEGWNIAVDGLGSAYVTGTTDSEDFPAVNAKYFRNMGWNDAFIVKFSANGQEIVYSTYLGGSGDDYGSGLAVDNVGNAYVTGDTYSIDFPTVNAKYPKLWGQIDAFVTKLSANGQTVIYSTYLGGSNDEVGIDISVDGVGNAYVTGSTDSPDFPTNNAQYQRLKGASDCFISKLSSDGQRLLYSTYLGGYYDYSADVGSGIAVDSIGNAYVTGLTTAPDFPTSATNSKIVSYDSTYNGGSGDAFVVKFANYALTVAKSGTGQGTVANSLGTINCGTTCTKTYAQPTSVTLTATPAANSRFVRWEGSCTGTTATCTLTVNEGKRVTAVFDSTLPLDAKPLIDSLTWLKQRMIAKVDADIATTARAFGDSKNLQRSLVWSDWLGTLFDLITGTLSTIATSLDIASEAKATLTNGIQAADSAYKAGIWIYTAQNLYQTLTEDGEKLQLAIDGPAYSTAVKTMLQNAYDNACVVVLGKCADFDQGVYETVIKNSLNQASTSMVLTLHRSSDIKRRKFEAVKGVLPAELRIARKLQGLIDALKAKGTVPAAFPMEATLDMLKLTREQVIRSQQSGTVAAYWSLLDNAGQKVWHSEKVSLGRIGDWERLRGVAVGHFIDDTTLAMQSVVNTAQDSIVNATTLAVTQKFKLPDGLEVWFDSHSILTTMTDMQLSSLKKTGTLTSRKAIDYAPEQMLNSLGEELADLWMIADDIANRIAQQAQVSP